MKQADRLNANYTIVIGDQELENNQIDIKNMETGESESIQLNQIVDYFHKQRGSFEMSKRTTYCGLVTEDLLNEK